MPTLPLPSGLCRAVDLHIDSSVLRGKIILAAWPSPRTQTRIWYKCLVGQFPLDMADCRNPWHPLMRIDDLLQHFGIDLPFRGRMEQLKEDFLNMGEPQ